MTDTTKIPVTTLVVTCIHLHEINLPAFFELRAAGWSVEITHLELGPDDPCIALDVRKLFPDPSPGISPGDELRDEVCKWLLAFEEKHDAFFDGIQTFKNPRAQDWKFNYWDLAWQTYEGGRES
jgi:hypothetical protein